MKRIITDTNIWYSISDKKIEEISRDHKLVIPIIVLNELYTSPNLWLSEATFIKLQNAIITVISNNSVLEFIELDPFEYLLKEVLPDIQPRLNLQDYLDELDALTKLKFEQVKNVRANRGDVSGLTNFINERSIGYKKLVDANKNKFKKLDTREYTMKYILTLANANLADLNSSFPKMESLDSERFELLINTFDDILREVSRSGKKIQDNDWIDIFNLTYANKGDLYWTKEKSKLKNIENSGCKSYMFNESFI